MSAFTPRELAYLQGERRLGRIATVGRVGTPHVTPVGWSYNAEHDTIDVGGRRLELVIDDLASTDPWRPRGVEVRGRAEPLDQPPLIRIYPERVVSWGL